MKLTEKLNKKTWDKKYYDASRKASESIHPAIEKIKNRYKNKTILEVGCGEGTKLGGFKAKKRVGVDVSEVAIKKAKAKIEEAIVADAINLPFENESFDAVLSFFSMEHFENPEEVIEEMNRVLKIGGEIAVVAPNFGSPNRSSPCFKGSRLLKLVRGYIKDVIPLSGNKLGWLKVDPISLDHGYESDFDTVVEPYLLSLKKYLMSQGFKIKEYSSNWEMEKEKSYKQSIFRVLSSLKIPPFTYWGPHLFIIAKKQ